MVRFFVILTILGLFISSSARAQATSAAAPPLSEAEAAWTLFKNACLGNAPDLDAWTADKSYLLEVGRSRADVLANARKVLEYPLPAKLVDVWSMTDSSILLAAFADGGCVVTSDTYIPPEVTDAVLKNLIKEVLASGGHPGHVATKIDDQKNAFYFMLPLNSPDARMKRYVMVHTYPNGRDTDLHTIFYYLETDQFLKL